MLQRKFPVAVMRHAILETVTISTDESNTEIRNQHLDPLKKILKEHAFPRQAAVGYVCAWGSEMAQDC